MGTFHSLCARVLRRDGAAIGIDPRFAIYDTDDQTSDDEAGPARPRAARHERAAAAGGPGPDRPLEERPDRPGRRRQSAAHGYLEEIAARGVRALPGAAAQGSRRPGLRRPAQRGRAALRAGARRARPLPGSLALPARRRVPGHQPRPIPVDPRCSPAQRKNLAVVGDDDQSIYSWRGADLRNILDFERDYPNATVVKLEQNYRSTQLILDAAHAVVSQQRGAQGQEAVDREPARRADRALRGRLGGRGGASGSRARSRRSSAAAARAARSSPGAPTRATSAATALRDIAVMYRTNAQSRAIEEAFLRYGLRYQLVGGTRFYQRREVKDALAYLRVLRSDYDVAAYERIINVPARGIGEKTIAAWCARRPAAAQATCGRRWWTLAKRRGGWAAGLGRPSPPSSRSSARCATGRRARPARAARRRARGVGLPADAGRRLAGGRGPLGQPARAARGGHALRATSSPRTRSTGCSRRRPWSPTRTRTRRTPTRSR